MPETIRHEAADDAGDAILAIPGEVTDRLLVQPPPHRRHESETRGNGRFQHAEQDSVDQGAGEVVTSSCALSKLSNEQRSNDGHTADRMPQKKQTMPIVRPVCTRLAEPGELSQRTYVIFLQDQVHWPRRHPDEL